MNQSTHFLGIDIGTTRFKMAIISQWGDIIHTFDYYYTTNNESHHTYDPDELSRALVLGLSSLSDAGKSGSIGAIGVTGHGPMLIPIDKNGNPCGVGIGYLDERIKKYSADARKKEPQRVTAPMYVPIALFYKHELPEIYNQTNTFLQSYDYIAFLLTHKRFTTVSSRWILPWDSNLLTSFGLDPHKFPPVRYMGTKLGEINETFSRRFNIPSRVPVIAMGGDFAMALVGSGTIKRGKAYDRSGSSGGINLCWNKSIKDPRLLSYRHLFKGLWNISGITTTAGTAIRWAQNLLDIHSVPNFSHKTTSTLFFPYLMGERTPLWDPFARGMWLGIKAGNSKMDLLFATIVGTILSLRDCIEVIEDKGVHFKDPIVATGWWNRHEWFVQLKADITGKRYITLQTSDVELLGIAIVCAVSMGIYTNIPSAVKSMCHVTSNYNYSKSTFAHYSQLYNRYRTIRRIFYESE